MSPLFPVSEIRFPQSPLAPSRYFRIVTPSKDGAVIARPIGWVAQLVEQRTENPRVGGSIPSPATLFFSSLDARHAGGLAKANWTFTLEHHVRRTIPDPQLYRRPVR